MDRRRAHGEIDDRGPVLLRNEVVLALGPVGVGVDEAWDDRLAGHVDRFRSGRNAHLPSPSHRDDAVAADDDDPVVDDPAVGGGHGDDPGAGERDNAAGAIGGDVHRKGKPAGRRLELGGVLGRRSGSEQGGGVDRVDGRTGAPVEPAAAPGPVDELGADRADPGHRKRAALGVGGDVLGAGHERHHKGLIILPEGDILAVRRDLVVAHHLAGRMDVLRLAVEVGADELALARRGDDHEQAVVRRSELGFGAVAGDPDRRSACRGDPIDSGIFGPAGRSQEAPLPALEDDRPAVGRKARTGVMAGLGRYLARGSAARRDGSDPAEAAVGPADEDDRPAVARPGREELELRLVALHQPARGPSRGGLDPQFAERLEHHLAAVGGNARPARHLRLEPVRSDLDLRMQSVDHDSGVVDPEWNLAAAAPVAVDPAKLAAGPEDDACAVRSPGHVGIDPGHRPGFLHVLVERIVDLALLARDEVLHIELGPGPLAADEGDLPAVRRRRRPDRAAGAGDDCRGLAGIEFVALDVEQVGVRILRILEGGAGGDVAGEINGLAVGRVDGLAQLLLVLLVGLLDQRNAAAAGDVVEPDLAGAERAPGGEMLLGGDEAAVRAPRRLVEEPEILLGQLALVRAVDVHDPDIVAAAAVRGEGDAAAVGRETRLLLVGEAFGDPGRSAAGDRQGVNVAEQVEGDEAPVAGNVDVHPGAVVDVYGNLPRGHARRGVDVPFGRLVGLGGGRPGGGGRKGAGRLLVRVDHLILGRLGFLDRRRGSRRGRNLSARLSGRQHHGDRRRHPIFHASLQPVSEGL